MRRLTDITFERGGLLVLTVLVVYVWLAPGHIVDGDNAEFATLGHIGGAAHPSGYPLYLLWLRAMSWLPLGPAHAAAVATALLGTALVAVLHAACRAWGARPLAATIAVSMFAGAPVVMRVHTEAEVFALNGLVAAAVLWLAAEHGPLRGLWRGTTLGLVAGLGLSNNLTCMLLAPIGILGCVRAIRESRRPWPLVCGAELAAFALGLVPYAYLLITPETPTSWGHLTSAGELLHHFLRKDYGGPGTFLQGGGAPPVGDNELALFAMLGRTWLWLPLLAGVGVLGLKCVRRQSAGEPRTGWWMLAICIAITGPLLVARFNIPTSWFSEYVARRFHLLPAMILAIPVAIALDQAGTYLRPRLRGELVGSRIPSVLAPILFIGLAATSLPYLARIHSPVVEVSIGNMLRSLPVGAAVIQSQDHLYWGSGYVQLVLGERRDVLVLSGPLAQHAWYRERWKRRGVTIEVDPRTMVKHLLAEGRPVFIDSSQPLLATTFPTYPFGILRRLLPVGAARPPLDDIVAENKRAFGSFDLGYPRPGPNDEYATDMHIKYAMTWQELGRALKAAGRPQEAREALQIARDLAPER